MKFYFVNSTWLICCWPSSFAFFVRTGKTLHLSRHSGREGLSESGSNRHCLNADSCLKQVVHEQCILTSSFCFLLLVDVEVGVLSRWSVFDISQTCRSVAALWSRNPSGGGSAWPGWWGRWKVKRDVWTVSVFVMASSTYVADVWAFYHHRRITLEIVVVTFIVEVVCVSLQKCNLLVKASHIIETISKPALLPSKLFYLLKSTRTTECVNHRASLMASLNLSIAHLW